MIAIIDYGMGNIHSVKKAVESLGYKASVIGNPLDLKNADKAILPGVGAFDDAMQELKAKGLDAAVSDFIKAGRPFLGICLGLQLFFETSEEARQEKGLGIIAGSVKRFQAQEGRKVPHMGWNQLKIKKADCPILSGIADGSSVYFCHSYYAAPEDPSITAAGCDYGVDFTSIAWRKNLYGVQFHPEKSQDVGMKILKNFLAL